MVNPVSPRKFGKRNARYIKPWRVPKNKKHRQMYKWVDANPKWLSSKSLGLRCFLLLYITYLLQVLNEQFFGTTTHKQIVLCELVTPCGSNKTTPVTAEEYLWKITNCDKFSYILFYIRLVTARKLGTVVNRAHISHMNMMLRRKKIRKPGCERKQRIKGQLMLIQKKAGYIR